MNRKECLDAAGEAVLKNRQSVYGPPEQSFADTAKVWSVILGVKISDWQVALCLVGLKVVRAKASPDHADNWADLAGYAACGAELATPPSPAVVELKLPGVTSREMAEGVARLQRVSRLNLGGQHTVVSACLTCGEAFPPNLGFCHNVACSASVVRPKDETPQFCQYCGKPRPCGKHEGWPT